MRDAEQRITEIWRAALRAGPEDGDAGFTELGGRGIDAALIAARIQQDLGITVPPSYLFCYPRLADFIARCRTEGRGQERWEHDPADGGGGHTADEHGSHRRARPPYVVSRPGRSAGTGGRGRPERA
ncbi:acyl carrier protein [Planomonospora corallina]|uniref:Acyl carrier protein n=1 Tax=Planomonospora corallina TaxID=1806052 RepID=A0ABV8I1Z0_9ACTN